MASQTAIVALGFRTQAKPREWSSQIVRYPRQRILSGAARLFLELHERIERSNYLLHLGADLRGLLDLAQVVAAIMDLCGQRRQRPREQVQCRELRNERDQGDAHQRDDQQPRQRLARARQPDPPRGAVDPQLEIEARRTGVVHPVDALDRLAEGGAELCEKFAGVAAALLCDPVLAAADAEAVGAEFCSERVAPGLGDETQRRDHVAQLQCDPSGHGAF